MLHHDNTQSTLRAAAIRAQTRSTKKYLESRLLREARFVERGCEHAQEAFRGDLIALINVNRSFRAEARQ